MSILIALIVASIISLIAWIILINLPFTKAYANVIAFLIFLVALLFALSGHSLL